MYYLLKDNDGHHIYYTDRLCISVKELVNCETCYWFNPVTEQFHEMYGLGNTFNDPSLEMVYSHRDQDTFLKYVMYLDAQYGEALRAVN